MSSASAITVPSAVSVAPLAVSLRAARLVYAGLVLFDGLDWS
ncbi:MAG: hypothetical protein U1F42_10735 [Candidatus Competibacteraceae bacterium]